MKTIYFALNDLDLKFLLFLTVTVQFVRRSQYRLDPCGLLDVEVSQAPSLGDLY